MFGTCGILLITRNKISGSLPAVKAKHSTVVSILKAVETKTSTKKFREFIFFQQKQANTLVGRMIKPLLTTFG